MNADGGRKLIIVIKNVLRKRVINSVCKQPPGILVMTVFNAFRAGNEATIIAQL